MGLAREEEERKKRRRLTETERRSEVEETGSEEMETIENRSEERKGREMKRSHVSHVRNEFYCIGLCL